MTLLDQMPPSATSGCARILANTISRSLVTKPPNNSLMLTRLAGGNEVVAWPAKLS